MNETRYFERNFAEYMLESLKVFSDVRKFSSAAPLATFMQTKFLLVLRLRNKILENLNP